MQGEQAARAGKIPNRGNIGVIRFIYNRFDAIFCKPTRTSIPQHGIEPVTPLNAHPLRSVRLGWHSPAFRLLSVSQNLHVNFGGTWPALHHHAAATAFSDEIGRQLDNGLIGG